MVQFNFSERTIKAKVVYYGPPQSGKTTNLEQIHRLTDPGGTNRLISLNTAQDRTLFFDLLPFSLGAVSGYDFKIQLYTVPGQVQYNATRRVVLAGADAVVFVADSQRSVARDNVAALENMKVNLLANRLVPEKVPLVVQYNKRDLPDLLRREELDQAVNPWGRKAFTAVAARGEGVLDTFMAVVKDMLAAIALKYNLREKGLDPDTVPDVVARAFEAVLRKAPTPSPTPPPRLVISQPANAEPAYPAQSGGEASPVSEELLHRAIRSNVELAEAFAQFVQEVNVGLGSILSHADLLMAYEDEERRNAAIGGIQSEARALRQRMQDLGQAAAQRPGPAGRAPGPPSAPPPPPRPVASTPPPASAPAYGIARPAAAAATLDGLLAEVTASAEATLRTQRVAVTSRLARGAALPRCSPATLRRATAALLQGLAATLPGSTIAVRAERKPVLLRSRDGAEVKRDFLMLGLSHPALPAQQQQRLLGGAEAGPLGEAYRLVREMGGFVRFAPLPGAGVETRVFLPAA
jgi:hypothetical protein